MEEEEKVLTVNASMDHLDEVIAFVEEQLESASCPLKVQGQICVSFEELYVNVANYAYGEESGECVIGMNISTVGNEKKMVLTVKDRGNPFNPLKKEDPDVTLSVEDRPIGGLGIYMVKQSMDDVMYEYQKGWNVIKIVKMWQIL